MLRQDDAFGSVRFALIVAIIIFNYTDATFKALHILYFTFILVSLSVGPIPVPDRREPAGDADATGGCKAEAERAFKH
jgi:hypothetical protein